MKSPLVVNAFWDEEAAVWVATSDDIPGLVTEAATLDRLRERIVAVAPELLADNAHHLGVGDPADATVKMCVLSDLHRHDNAA